MHFRKASLGSLKRPRFFGPGDPIFDLGGAYFPAWLAVVLGGIGTVICIRWILDRTGIESFLGPRGLVYICMFVVFSIIYWFIFFET